MFSSGSCEYLGHVVGNGTVRPMDCKVASVRDFKVPLTKKDVRSFLGLYGYYRKFMPNFSTMVTPLTELTKKRMPNKVKWTTQCDHAFSELKEALTRAPILVTPDWNLPFILQTDASATGLGYVLSQVNGKGEEHPIAYASKKLLASEKIYSAIEREALAIVKGIKHFRTYLEGSTFTVQTDHNPLTHLGNLKDSHGRLARWALSLQPYDFAIVHRSGKVNANTDGLSRDQGSLAKVWGVSEALVAETVPDTLTKEKQKLIINTSSCEQDNCESVGCGLQPNRSKATDISKGVDNLEELDRNMLRICRTHHMWRHLRHLTGSQSNQEMMMNDNVA